jgi:xylulose-5-phosphate/fructose-6-phosphate phosphoketolase
MLRLFRQFSSPGGIPSHVSVTTPGSIHEGGELGYVLVHAFGAVMDSPDLLAVAVVGDGEAETGPLEGSWKGVSFLNPTRDGAVLPVLHLNGAKIAGPTVLGRKDPAEVRSLLSGHGYDVIEVGGDDVPGMHLRFAEAMTRAWAAIREIQAAARGGDWDGTRPRWPLIVLRTPKGWTGPDVVDGVQVRGTWRAHQVPLSNVKGNPAHLRLLEDWLRSYRPEELFDDNGAPRALVRRANPAGDLRMSATPHANGGRLTRDLVLPDFRDYAVDVPHPAALRSESTRKLGEMMRDIYAANPDRFRLCCPDETNSNRLGAVFEASDRAFAERVSPEDVSLSRDGRVMEVLSEHNCHGWLEGYTLTGRHGWFATYEAFAMVSASQTIQHSKWLEEAANLAWRNQVPSLNILLTSTAWRNDHNGFSHQGPGLIQNVITQRGTTSRVYLPPDAN